MKKKLKLKAFRSCDFVNLVLARASIILSITPKKGILYMTIYNNSATSVAIAIKFW